MQTIRVQEYLFHSEDHYEAIATLSNYLLSDEPISITPLDEAPIILQLVFDEKAVDPQRLVEELSKAGYSTMPETGSTRIQPAARYAFQPVQTG